MLDSSIYWLMIMAVFILIEILTLGLISIWFAAGALLAFIISLFCDSLILEIIMFLIVSISLMYTTRPLVFQYLHPNKNKSGFDGVIGREATVLITIDNKKALGKVSVDGQEWSAKALDNGIIEKGETVTVQGVSNAKLIVTGRFEQNS